MLREIRGWTWNSMDQKYLVRTLEMTCDSNFLPVTKNLVGWTREYALDVDDPGELRHSLSVQVHYKIKFYICYSDIWDCPELFFEGYLRETNSRLALEQILEILKIPDSSVSLIQQKVYMIRLITGHLLIYLKPFYSNIRFCIILSSQSTCATSKKLLRNCSLQTNSCYG